jgi:hypothetical protein
MPTTPGGLRFPSGSDTPDVPRDIENLANDVEALVANIPTGLDPFLLMGA